MRMESSEIENKANAAFAGSRQANLRDMNFIINQETQPSQGEETQPSEDEEKGEDSRPKLWQWRRWSKKKKAILCILSILIILIILIAVLAPVLSVNHRKVLSERPPSSTKTAPIASPPLSTSAMTQTTVSPPPVATADGVHLVNSVHQFAPAGSELAYYKSAVDGTDATLQRQPDDTTVIAVNMDAQWEGQNRTGNSTVTNTKWWAFTNATATNAQVNATVGEAGNGERSFVCYKDNGRILYALNDIYFYSFYFCQ